MAAICGRASNDGWPFTAAVAAELKVWKSTASKTARGNRTISIGPATVAAQRIGQADVGVTLKVYAHVMPGDDEAAAVAANHLLRVAV